MSYQPITFYNSATKQREELLPTEPVTTMYSCGPTVYSRATLGNLRTIIMYDLITRELSWLGRPVKWVMNYTDVGHLVSDADTGEDKLARQATIEKKTAWDIAAANISQFEADAAALRLLPPDGRSIIRVRATDYIEQMCDLVRRLNDKGVLYQIDDGWYFDTSKYARYGEFAELDIAGLKEGARVDKNPQKRQPIDFAVWKFSPPGQQRDMEWANPIGEGQGFPGWHLECSAIINQEFAGETLNLHLGGIDLKTIHHQNEIAQSETAYEHSLATIWLHTEHLMIDGRRMGKSEGNMYSLTDLTERGFSPLDLRYFVLTAHYRSQQNFTWEALTAARTARLKLSRLVYEQNEGEDKPNGWGDKLADEEVVMAIKTTVAADADFPRALALLWEFVGSSRQPAVVAATVAAVDEALFNCLDAAPALVPVTASEEVTSWLRQREQARSRQDFAAADALRQQIEQAGYIIEDTKEGPQLKAVS